MKGDSVKLYEQGLAAHRRGDWERAIALYNRALICALPSPHLHYHLGLLLDQQNRLALAIEQYQQTLVLNSHHLGAMENLGCAYVKLRQAERAIATLQQGITLQPQSASLWNNLGQALQLDGNIEGAIAAYKRAIQLQPDLTVAHVNLGYLWVEEGQVAAAIAQFQHILTLDPSNLSAHSHCAQLYWQQGRVTVALAHWRQIATLQAHLLRPYCQFVQQEQRKIAQGQIPDDLRHRAQQACAQFLHGLLHNESVPTIRQPLQQTYEHWGRLLAQQDDGAPLAEYYFRQALRLQPRDGSLLLKLAHTLDQQQRFDGAIALHALAHPLTPSRHALPHSPPTPHSPPYCQSTTPTWINTTTLTPLYHPIPPTYPPIPPTYPPTPPLPTPCGGLTCSPCMATLRAKFQPYSVRPHILKCGPNGMEPGAIAPHLPFPTFVVTIPQGRCWVEPQRHSSAICDNMAVITPDRTLLQDVSRYYPWPLPGCPRPQQTYHPLLKAEPTLPPVRYLEGRVALLSGLSGHIYYHWLMDVLPRLDLLRRGGWTWGDIDAFVVNSTQRPFQRETLALLGIPETKIIESDRHPHLQAAELIVPSFPGYLGWVPPTTLKFLRSHFLPLISSSAPPLPPSPSAPTFSPTPHPPTPSPPYLYISRAQASYRHLVNETELLQQLHPLGFVAIALETLTIQQQVALFAHAKIVVAPHGAGLTNTVFCQPGTQVVEIASPHYVQSDYWVVSHQAGLTHYLVMGQTVDCDRFRQIMYQNPLTEDMWLSAAMIESVVALLRDMIQGENHE